MILKNGDDILIVECKGAMSTTKNPTLRGNSLNTKTLGPQLSHGWLTNKRNRYLSYIKDQLRTDDYLMFEEILEGTKKYKTAVVYASDNPTITFAGKMDDYVGKLVNDTMVESFDLIKLH